MSLYIAVDNDRILIHPNNHNGVQERIERVPERSWDRERGAWSIPATPEAARRVREAFRGFGTARVSRAFQRLLAAERAAAPAALTTPLWNHQREALAFMLPKRAGMLYHEPGAGKTLTTLALILARGHQRVLVIAPSRVVTTWADQIRRHAGDAIRAIPLEKGTVAKRTERARAALEAPVATPAVIIINYEAARSGRFHDWSLGQQWDLVVLDESHRIKAPGGQGSRYAAALGRRADYRLCLTGTPMPHSPLDIYAQFRFLDPAIFGTRFSMFRARYALMRQAPWGPQVIGFQREGELHDKIFSITHHVKTADVLDLPEALDEIVPVELPATARSVYRELADEFYAEIGAGTVTAANALTKLLRLQQVTSGYTVLDDDGTEHELHTAKADALAEILADMPPDEPVVVFARFKHDLDQIRRVTERTGRRYAEISGRVDEADYRAFAAGERDVIGVQIQAGGEGLNDLVRARYCVYYSLGHSLGQYQQSRARLHRPGQKRNVVYYHLVGRNTIDETVYAALDRRQDVIAAILEQGKEHP